MNFYKRHLGDVAKACGHLSQGAMGAYDLLLDWHYANELPLPLTKAELYRIGRAFTKAERNNVDQVLGLFFQLTDAGYVQKRALEEMAKANAQAETNAKIAAEREARRRAARDQRNEHESCDDPCTNRSTKYQPSQTPDTRLQTPDKSKSSPPTHHRDLPAQGADGVGGTPVGHVAAALQRAGLRVTSQNPKLIAAVEAGVTAAALLEFAQLYPDKPAGYVIAAAHRQHTEGASAPGAPHGTQPLGRRPSLVERAQQSERELADGRPGLTVIDGSARRVR